MGVKKNKRLGLQVKLVNSNGTLNVYAGEIFIYNNKKLYIFSCNSNEHESTTDYNYSVWQTKDSFKNVDTGNIIEYTRRKLLRLDLTVTIC